MSAIANYQVSRRAIFGGTSLNISEALSIAKPILREGNRFFSVLNSSFGNGGLDLATNRNPEPQVISKFPLVTDANAERVLREELRGLGLFKQGSLDEAKLEKSLGAAVSASALLRGRVKWTAMYAERIIKGRNGADVLALSTSELSELAKVTYEDVVKSLWNRLDDIQAKQDGERLLDMLLEAAISADILCRPHIFAEEGLELVERGFAIVEQIATEDLASQSEWTIKGSLQNHSIIAKLKEDRSIQDTTRKLLAKVIEYKLEIQEYTISRLTAEEAEKGFIIVDCFSSMDTQAAQLKDQVGPERNVGLGAKRLGDSPMRQEAGGPVAKKGATADTTVGKRLANRAKTVREICESTVEIIYDPNQHGVFQGRLKQKDDSTGNKLDDMIRRLKAKGFQTLNRKVDQLANELTILVGTSQKAKLSEPVVIDAIIRFSFERLNRKFMDFMSLAPNVGTIGCPAERYLCIRLGSYLNGAPRTRDHSLSGVIADTTQDPRQSWEHNRKCILNHLSKATNPKKEMIQGLEDYVLVVGARTIQEFNSGSEWATGFGNWLDAIQRGVGQPNASFLLPHPELGPDIVFALRKQTNPEKIILCSVQLKLGGATPGAVNKSSISWVYYRRLPSAQDDVTRLETEKENWDIIICKQEQLDGPQMTLLENGRKNAEKELKKAKNKLNKLNGANCLPEDLKSIREILENDFWHRQPRLNLLIRARGGDDTGNSRPAQARTEDDPLEYFANIGEDATEDLFGKPFKAALEMLQE